MWLESLVRSAAAVSHLAAAVRNWAAALLRRWSGGNSGADQSALQRACEAAVAGEGGREGGVRGGDGAARSSCPGRSIETPELTRTARLATNHL